MIPESEQPSSDQKLAHQIAQGNEMAFAHFYDRHWDTLFISAFKVLKDEEACKDIVQEVFISVWENSKLHQVENIKAYLYQSVRYRVLMALRRGKISDNHLQTLKELVSNTTEEQLDLAEISEKIEHSIKSLPEKCQQVFRLSREQHLSNQQIAMELGISVRTVETHISNALRQIRSRLNASAAVVMLLLLLC